MPSPAPPVNEEQPELPPLEVLADIIGPSPRTPDQETGVKGRISARHLVPDGHSRRSDNSGTRSSSFREYSPEANERRNTSSGTGTSSFLRELRRKLSQIELEVSEKVTDFEAMIVMLKQDNLTLKELLEENMTRSPTLEDGAASVDKTSHAKRVSSWTTIDKVSPDDEPLDDVALEQAAMQVNADENSSIDSENITVSSEATDNVSIWTPPTAGEENLRSSSTQTRKSCVPSTENEPEAEEDSLPARPRTSKKASVSKRHRSQQPQHYSKGSDSPVYELWPTLKELSKNQTSVSKSKMLSQTVAHQQMKGLASNQEGEDPLWIFRLWGKIMMSPVSTYSLSWDMISLMLIAYDCVMVPMSTFDIPDSEFFLFMDWFLRIFWSFSIPRGCITGHVNDDGEISFQPRKVLWRYVTEWFALDLAISLYDWISYFVQLNQFADAARAAKGTRLLRLIRVLRLARMFKLPALVQKFSDLFIDDRALCVIGIFKISVIFLGICHIIACAWYGIGTIDDSGETWLKHFNFQDSSLFYSYMVSMHWSVTQFIGNCELFPMNAVERTFSACTLCMTFILSSYYISGITTCLTRLEILSTAQESQFSALGRYLHFRKVSPNLAMRVMKSARYVINEQAKNIREQDVHMLQIISEPLQVEICYEIFSPQLCTHPFFHTLNSVNKGAMNRICHRAITSLLLNTGDTLFIADEVPKPARMFFLTAGNMSYQFEDSDGTVMDAKMHHGAYFCEACLWVPWTHVGNLVSLTNCSMLALDVVKCHQVLAEYKREVTGILKYAWAFLHYANDTSQQGMVLKDIADENFNAELAATIAFRAVRRRSKMHESA